VGPAAECIRVDLLRPKREAGSSGACGLLRPGPGELEGKGAALVGSRSRVSQRPRPTSEVAETDAVVVRRSPACTCGGHGARTPPRVRFACAARIGQDGAHSARQLQLKEDALNAISLAE